MNTSCKLRIRNFALSHGQLQPLQYLRVCLQEEIYSSSYAAAAYLESIDFPKDKKVRQEQVATL